MTDMNKIMVCQILSMALLFPVASSFFFKYNSKWKASVEKCLKEEKRDIRTCKHLASMEENER
jgi:hypothetical protein|tara:strand:+ start:149 stop:337 length:189 start_codon:yes stop_codon:yes gene_type:complete